jgi:predicted metalloendopeptidase
VEEYPFVLDRANYLANYRTLITAAVEKHRAKIGQPVDRMDSVGLGTTINAYYVEPGNIVVLPVAILQPPIYNRNAHPAQNFGAVGVVIGHELTHAFDAEGRYYDGDGNLRDWWTNATSNEFEDRATCMKEQYRELVAYGDSGKPVGKVDGNLTVSENIADNGGLDVAFDAYHTWMGRNPTLEKRGVTDEEAAKLFFVSFGQVWCSQIRDAALKQQLLSDSHSPAPVRVNGVVMNSAAFSQTFQCPVGSNMNPVNKCKLW